MKKILNFIFCCFFTINIFGYSGVLAGAEDVKIVKTTWFDIIYPSSSEKTAGILYDNADKIYEEVTSQYGLEPTFRMPVVITDQVDTYNAFNTPVPYNRIVLYNTSTNSLDDASALNDLFLTTFRHELTHAVTFNIKNGFWNVVTKIFGDPILPGCFFITPGMAEGAAVASESSSGDGRLNDDFATHFVKQAKIENSFPSYYDVQGANSSTSLALHYYFNGPFHEYLQNKYGMEKYTEFWHRVINLNRPGVNWSFKKTYGKSIRKEWKLFEESYSVPNVIENPIENKLVNDFFIPENNKASIFNSNGCRYSDLHNCDTGLFFTNDMVRNKNSKEILFVSNENLNDKKIKPKSVSIQQLMEGFSPSRDGRFLAISYYSTAKPNIKSKIKIYDLQNDSYFFVEEDSLKDGSIIKSGDDYYLVCHKYISPNNNLFIKKLVIENNSIVGLENIYSESMDINCFISDFTDVGNGTFAYIKKIYGDFSIILSDVNGNKKGDFILPEGYKIRQLSESGGEIYFSWVKQNTMARLGRLNISTETFTFSNTDFSGGIFNPVLLNYGDGQRLTYVGCFFNENKVLTIDPFSHVLTESETKESSKYNNVNSEYKNKEYTDISLISEPYKKMKNLHGGIIVPFSIYESNLIGKNYGMSSPSQLLPFGITFATTNPWNGGSLADDLFILTAGWSYLTNSFGIEAIINQGSGTSLYGYSIDLKTEFDMNGWKQSAGNLILTSGFHVGNVSTVILKNDFVMTGGRQNNLNNNISYLSHFAFGDNSLFQSCAPVNDDIALNIIDVFSINYSSIHSTGPGKFENSGLNAGFGTGFVYDSELGHGIVINSNLSVYIPKLIPITQKRGFTYNLPIKFDFSLFPYVSNYGFTGESIKTADSGVLDSNIEMILFGLDVEKSIPYFETFFINDFSISAGYCSTIASYKGHKRATCQFPYMFEYFSNLTNGKSAYLDSAYLKMSLKLTPNIGLLANSSGMTSLNFYGKISYPINVINEENRKLNFSFGFNGSF